MISKKQMDALKYLIIHSKDASDLVKKALFFLIEHSDSFQKPVCITFVETKDGFTKEDVLQVYNGVHDMKSSQTTTHLNELMKAAGCDSLFYVHAGAYQIDGEFKEYEKILSYTVWVSVERYDHNAQRVSITKKLLGEVPLKSELYDREKTA